MWCQLAINTNDLPFPENVWFESAVTTQPPPACRNRLYLLFLYNNTCLLTTMLVTWTESGFNVVAADFQGVSCSCFNRAKDKITEKQRGKYQVIMSWRSDPVRLSTGFCFDSKMKVGLRTDKPSKTNNCPGARKNYRNISTPLANDSHSLRTYLLASSIYQHKVMFWMAAISTH